MFQSLKPIAEVRKHNWRWDASLYPSLGRNCAPNQPSLAMHREPLTEIIRHANTGFPAHAALRTVFTMLQDHFQVFGDSIPQHRVWREASEAADSWRVMCKHLYNLKKGKPPLTEEELEPILGMIVLPSQAADESQQSQAAEAGVEQSAGAPGEHAPKPTAEGDVSGGVVEEQRFTPGDVQAMLPRELFTSDDAADKDEPPPAAVAPEGPVAVVGRPETWVRTGPKGEQIFLGQITIDTDDDDETPIVTDLVCNCDECIAYAAQFVSKGKGRAKPRAEGKKRKRSAGPRAKGAPAVEFESEVVPPQKKEAVIEGIEPPPPMPVLAPPTEQDPPAIELPRQGKLVIPSAARGGQKKDTLKRRAELEDERKARSAATTVTPKRRVTGKKTSPSVSVSEEVHGEPAEEKVPEPKGKAQGKAKNKAKGKAKNKAAQQDMPDPEKIIFPITMEVHQRTQARCADAYLLRATKRDRYIAGQTEKASA